MDFSLWRRIQNLFLMFIMNLNSSYLLKALLFCIEKVKCWNSEGINIRLFYQKMNILFLNFCLQETDDKIHVVIGNESCDLDSVVAALTYGYFLHKVTPSVITNNETLH